MSLRATVAALVFSAGCGAPNGSIPSPSPGAQPARKLEGPLISAAVGSFKPTFFYGPWQCNQRFMDACTRQCAIEGYKLMGCIWLADLKLDWQGGGVQAGGRRAFFHCCCTYPELTKGENEAKRKLWENARKKFREDWSRKFGNWPTADGKSWPGHHIRDLLHGGDPTDAENILPAPPDTHDLFNKAYPACYAGAPPWNTVGPDLPYLDY
ncbi:hypothetical protein [Hyalangium gracile]|uniref:hypothetical protein n=1 Tax=Hyalangium gracile TaxID=394092 RepID=UPI001CCB319C|nr:hypothetical protein [Hyalangium gracile]